MGVALGHRSYPMIKYLIVLLIVAGVALFLYKDKGNHTLANVSDQERLFDLIGIGEFLLVSQTTHRHTLTTSCAHGIYPHTDHLSIL